MNDKQIIEMGYLDILRKVAKDKQSIVCIGIDPVLEKIPVEEKDPTDAIKKFYLDIFAEMKKQNVYPACVKPNSAFFEQFGPAGMECMRTIIDNAHEIGLPVILDVKRGDIGNTSKAYAHAAFEIYDADSVTLNPFLGHDSLTPFFDFKEKGFYVLCRTSNPGAKDFQDMLIEGTPIYKKVAEKLVEWHFDGLGAVVGATYPKELSELLEFFKEKGKEVPFLIPGVGKQGGSASEIAKILKDKSDVLIHRINSSSGINYAYKRYNMKNYAEAAVKALNELNEEIGEL